MKLEELKSEMDRLMSDADRRYADATTADLRSEIRKVAEAAERVNERLGEHIVANARDHTRLEARVNSQEHRVGALERKKARGK